MASSNSNMNESEPQAKQVVVIPPAPPAQEENINCIVYDFNLWKVVLAFLNIMVLKLIYELLILNNGAASSPSSNH
ncbi:transmembrane protein, putative [Medicago truncatula]|uniref:Transmembrane protein, putative n=1 Tax=Medicago truncatula TaxID=3880 RepID=G7KLB7_MEDTR|nr:transmembrane protein, putative [Medicago truncatula]